MSPLLDERELIEIESVSTEPRCISKFPLLLIYVGQLKYLQKRVDQLQYLYTIYLHMPICISTTKPTNTLMINPSQ